MAIEVCGGRQLSGEISLQGSKNAILPLMAAALLCEGKTVVHHSPKIRDVSAMMDVLKEMGCGAVFENRSLCLDCSKITDTSICQNTAKEIRGSILLLGSCLARFGEVTIVYPGGCSIGKRPVDYHIRAFRRMGVTIEEKGDRLSCRCKKQIRGADLVLPFPSVGATENIILVAVLANGETTIKNAAKEPEIVELCSFLRRAGAFIKGDGTSVIHIKGRKKLHAIEWTLSGDRVAFWTYAMFVAGCGGEISFSAKDLFGTKEREVWHCVGGSEATCDNMVILKKTGVTEAIRYLHTGPWPEFPTDDQSLLLPVLTRANGVSTIEERVFENRFHMVEQLKKMGANIDSVSNRARITGVTKLHGAEVTARDLRSGAGLLIAAAMADGVSVIDGEELIWRGYENIVDNMKKIGIKARYCG